MFIPDVRAFLILQVSFLVIAPLARHQEAGRADPRAWQILFESERDGHREIYYESRRF